MTLAVGIPVDALEGTRVLIVSGDCLLPRRLSTQMGHAGCSVTAVAAPDEALALLRIGYRPGLLMLDGGLPESDRLGLAGAVMRTAPPGAVTIVTLRGAA